MAVATFGDVEVSLSWEALHLVMSERHFFVASAALVKYPSKSRSAKCCHFHTKMHLRTGQVSSTIRRVRDDQFMLGSRSNHPPVQMTQQLSQCQKKPRPKAHAASAKSAASGVSAGMVKKRNMQEIDAWEHWSYDWLQTPPSDVMSSEMVIGREIGFIQRL